MITKTVQVENPHGIHLRIAAKIVEISKQNQCRIDFNKNGLKASSRSIMELLILEATPKSSLTVTTTGKNEEQTLGAVEMLLMDGAGI